MNKFSNNPDHNSRKTAVSNHHPRSSKRSDWEKQWEPRCDDESIIAGNCAAT